MDYHQDRFDDYSLLIYFNENLCAILPANRQEDIVYSHQGLSYGGLLLQKASKFVEVLQIFQKLLKYLKDHNISEIRLKKAPRIYNQLPSDEIDYLLFKTRAMRYRCDVSMVIDNLNTKIPLSSNRRRNLKKAEANGIAVKEVADFESFFNEILIPNLQGKYKTFPTHSVKEITLLKSKFPNKIRQFNAYQDDQIIAGVTVFEMTNVAHAQYISVLNSKSKFGGLDAILDYLINSVFQDKHYFSFGISNENHGQNINEGLLNWKESFGARTIVHEFHSIKTENYKLLENVMI